MSEHTEATEKPAPAEKPDQLEPAEQPEQHEHHPAKQSSGSSGPFVAILLALIAIIAVFLLWQKQRAMNADTQALQGSVGKLLSVVEQRHQQQMQQLSELSSHQHQATEAEVERIASQLQDLYTRVGHGQQGWFIAEMEYLLRTASHHLSLERDKKTALTALQQARQRMSGEDLDIYQPVIQQIDKDIARINAISLPDRNQIAAEIGKLLAASEQWPFAVSTNHVADDAQPAPTTGPETGEPTGQKSRLASLLDRIWNDLKGLVTIRRNGDVAQPLLQPQQRYFLQQNLQLKLQAARLALHAGDNIAFRDSLIEAEEWLKRYFDTGSLSVSEAQATIKQLATLDLSPELPALGDNIALLHRVAMQILPPVTVPQRTTATPPPAQEKQKEAKAPAKSTPPKPPEPATPQAQPEPAAKASPKKDASKPTTQTPAADVDVPEQPEGDAQ